MKKMIALVVALITVLTIPTVAFAANQTVLTTTVPAATYTLNVPADQTVDFGDTEIFLPGLAIEDAFGFAAGKGVAVTIIYDAFVCEGVNTTIPITLKANYITGISGTYADTFESGDSLLFTYSGSRLVPSSYVSGNTTYNLTSLSVTTNSADWGKALAGEYTATITFTAEVVAY